MIYAIILAGGSGSRMGATDMPKQFLMLKTKPIIVHTLEHFLNNPLIKEVIVCAPKIWITHTENLVEEYIFDKKRVTVIEGGNSRNESVIAGCKYIKKNFGLKNEDVVITHDAVRPFITQRIINDNIDASKKYVAVDTVIAATDTIVVSKNGKIIENIPVRKEMYMGQTPQTFNLKKLMEYYDKTSEDSKKILTDTCKLMLLNGEEVALVDGEDYNIKITTQYDLKIANAILDVREND